VVNENGPHPAHRGAVAPGPQWVRGAVAAGGL